MPDCVKLDKCESGTYNKILFVGEHNIHCIDIISAIWLVYNEFVFLEWNAVMKKEVWARIQRESQKKYKWMWLTFSRKCWPHRWSFQGSSPVLSSRMRNLRWKLRSLLRLGNRRWMVSWSIRLDWERALEYFYVFPCWRENKVAEKGAHLHYLKILNIFTLCIQDFLDYMFALCILTCGGKWDKRIGQWVKWGVSWDRGRRRWWVLECIWW